MLYMQIHTLLTYVVAFVGRGIKFQDLCVWISLLKNHDTLIMASISRKKSVLLHYFALTIM